jgi:hypothetical protein
VKRDGGASGKVFGGQGLEGVKVGPRTFVVGQEGRVNVLEPNSGDHILSIQVNTQSLLRPAMLSEVDRRPKIHETLYAILSEQRMRSRKDT